MFGRLRLFLRALACAPIRGPLGPGELRLPKTLQAELSSEFPDLELSGVVLVIDGPPSFIKKVAPIHPIAVTLGMVVFMEERVRRVDADLDFRLIVHELTHVEQYCRHGVSGFLVRYFGAYALNRMRGMSGEAAYRAIPFEIAARRREERVERARRDRRNKNDSLTDENFIE